MGRNQCNSMLKQLHSFPMFRVNPNNSNMESSACSRAFRWKSDCEGGISYARFHQRGLPSAFINRSNRSRSSVAIDLIERKIAQELDAQVRPGTTFPAPRGSSTPSSVGADPKIRNLFEVIACLLGASRGFGSKCARFGLEGLNPHTVFAFARHSGACWWQPQG